MMKLLLAPVGTPPRIGGVPISSSSQQPAWQGGVHWTCLFSRARDEWSEQVFNDAAALTGCPAHVTDARRTSGVEAQSDDDRAAQVTKFRTVDTTG
jgi:hypothetical protein